MDVYELLEMAMKYEKGDGVQPNIEKAKYYYNEAAKLNNPEGRFKLAMISFHEKNNALALEHMNTLFTTCTINDPELLKSTILFYLQMVCLNIFDNKEDKYLNACETMTKSYEDIAHDGKAYYYLSQCYMAYGDTEKEKLNLQKSFDNGNILPNEDLKKINKIVSDSKNIIGKVKSVLEQLKQNYNIDKFYYITRFSSQSVALEIFKENITAMNDRNSVFKSFVENVNNGNINFNIDLQYIPAYILRYQTNGTTISWKKKKDLGDNITSIHTGKLNVPYRDVFTDMIPISNIYKSFDSKSVFLDQLAQCYSEEIPDDLNIQIPNDEKLYKDKFSKLSQSMVLDIYKVLHHEALKELSKQRLEYDNHVDDMDIDRVLTAIVFIPFYSIKFTYQDNDYECLLSGCSNDKLYNLPGYKHKVKQNKIIQNTIATRNIIIGILSLAFLIFYFLTVPIPAHPLDYTTNIIARFIINLNTIIGITNVVLCLIKSNNLRLKRSRTILLITLIAFLIFLLAVGFTFVYKFNF